MFTSEPEYNTRAKHSTIPEYYVGRPVTLEPFTYANNYQLVVGMCIHNTPNINPNKIVSIKYVVTKEHPSIRDDNILGGRRQYSRQIKM